MHEKPFRNLLLVTLVLAPFRLFAESGRPLFASFESYSSYSAFAQRADPESITFLDDSGLPEGDSRPPFNIITVSTTYEHLGEKGKLRLSYFNDRLMEVWFCPNDVASFLDVLAAEGRDLTKREEVLASKHTTVRRGQDMEKRIYVSWSDRRLVKELNSWIANYS